MNGFFRHLSEALAFGPVVLITVVTARGSTPRIAGARQFLATRGDFHGTIGGGATEARALEQARETLCDGQPRQFLADLRGRPGDIREGVCGGTMDVWIVRLETTHLPLVRKVDESLRAGKRVSLATRLDPASPLLLDASPNDAFAEILEPTPRLLIVGAGHIGRSLARLAGDLDFSVIVQDDRREWLDPASFPPTCGLETELSPAAEALQRWEGERFATLVTRGFPQDVAALNALATIPGLTYLGLLGSKARIATVLAAQRASGGPALPEGVLHAPVGIEIGAETPEEIAISIAAELVQFRRRNREFAARSRS